MRRLIAGSPQPRFPGAERQSCLPRTRLGHQQRPAGLRQLGFICLVEGGRTWEGDHSSLPTVQPACFAPGD